MTLFVLCINPITAVIQSCGRDKGCGSKEAGCAYNPGKLINIAVKRGHLLAAIHMAERLFKTTKWVVVIAETELTFFIYCPLQHLTILQGLSIWCFRHSGSKRTAAMRAQCTAAIHAHMDETLSEWDIINTCAASTHTATSCTNRQKMIKCFQRTRRCWRSLAVCDFYQFVFRLPTISQSEPEKDQTLLSLHSLCLCIGSTPIVLMFSYFTCGTSICTCPPEAETGTSG